MINKDFMCIDVKNLKMGTVLEFVDIEVAERLLDERIINGFDFRIFKENQGLKFVVNSNVLEKALLGNEYWYFVNDEAVSCYVLKECDTSNMANTLCFEKDWDVINEMISKVDKKRVKRLLSILASDNTFTAIINDSYVNETLTKWAYAKYEYYLMFGRNLKITEETEIDVDVMDIKPMVKDLKMKYLKYYPLLDMFDPLDFLTNTLNFVPFMLRDMLPNVTKGTKLSKVLYKITQDDDFITDLSKISQQKKCTANLTISIDPYDYLTSSVNKNNWRSCHNIVDGEYGIGSASYMLDETTLVSYRSNNVDYEYSYYNICFKGNSKSFRQLIYMDKHTASFIMCRAYPNESKKITERTQNMLRRAVEDYTQIQCSLDADLGINFDIKHMSDLHYCDVSSSGKTFKICQGLKGFHNQFLVGQEVQCPNCYDKVYEESEGLYCYDCYNALTEDDEDDEWEEI